MSVPDRGTYVVTVEKLVGGLWVWRIKRDGFSWASYTHRIGRGDYGRFRSKEKAVREAEREVQDNIRERLRQEQLAADFVPEQETFTIQGPPA